MASPSVFGAHLALSAASLIYGINYFTLKGVLNEGHDPLAVLALRCFSATLLFVVFHVLFIREKIREWKDFGLLLLCALFGVTINQTFYIWGMDNTEVINASVLMVPTPVFVFLAALLFRTENMTLRKLAGLAVSFAGALTLILYNTGGGFSISGSTIAGDLMIMTNAASYGIYLVLVRPLLLKYNAFTITMWIFVFGSVPNILFGLSSLLTTDPAGVSTEAWLGMAYLVVFSTVAAYFLNAYGMKTLNSSAAGVYIYVQPVFVTLFSVILNKGGITEVKIFCMAVIFLGVYLVTSPPRNPRPSTGVHR